MNNITNQIYGLRLKFKNENIFNMCTKDILSLEEGEAIEAIIKNEKTDGIYEVGDDLIITLDNGIVYIKDTYNE